MTVLAVCGAWLLLFALSTQVFSSHQPCDPVLADLQTICDQFGMHSRTAIRLSAPAVDRTDHGQQFLICLSLLTDRPGLPGIVATR